MTNPVATIRHIDDHGDKYDAIMVWCPGCEVKNPDGPNSGGLNMLPITGDSTKRPTWGFNGDLEVVTLTPSILTQATYSIPKPRRFICHSFLTDGIWNFLTDSTHDLAGKTAPMVPLPDWCIS